MSMVDRCAYYSLWDLPLSFMDDSERSFVPCPPLRLRPGIVMPRFLFSSRNVMFPHQLLISL